MVTTICLIFLLIQSITIFVNITLILLNQIIAIGCTRTFRKLTIYAGNPAIVFFILAVCFFNFLILLLNLLILRQNFLVQLGLLL